VVEPEDAPGEAVLITGLFGSGKSSVAVEMADILEKRGARYAVVDLDWLSWGWAGGDEVGAEHRMMLRNLAPVVRNYLDAGVRLFILARAIREGWELESLRASLPVPLRVVELRVPWAEIERRLRSDVTTSRADDLRDAVAWAASSDGSSIGDITVSNDRPIRDVATDILDRLGWP
jgi:energy-coupling factor transporter ATP-binding protein EcfA2